VKGCVIKALELELSIDEIADDEALFEGGLGLNSIATLQVIAAVEEEFGIEVPDEDLTPELIESVRTLANYVDSVSSSSISSLSGMPS
jgi:acyl carrier protein